MATHRNRTLIKQWHQNQAEFGVRCVDIIDSVSNDI